MIQSTYKILSQIISRCYDFFKTFTFTASVLLRWLFLKHLFDKKQKKPQFNLKMCIFPECHSWSCYVNNWPFAWLGHMVQNRTCWRARPKTLQLVPVHLDLPLFWKTCDFVPYDRSMQRAYYWKTENQTFNTLAINSKVLATRQYSFYPQKWVGPCVITG